LRIAILGNSGSGKSTLSHWIARRTGAAALDLDAVVWEPNQIAVPRSPTTATRDVEMFCSERDSWIVEGCYASFVSVALRFEPHLLLLDPGRAACVKHCRARPWEPHKFESKTAQDEHLSSLLTWVSEYYTRDGDMSLAAHAACFDRYNGAKTRVTAALTYASPTPQMMSWLR
jgi:adenylate kinase family enzyme